MSIEFVTENHAIVDEYSLYDMLISVQSLVQQGFEICSEGDNYPQGISGWYRCGMIRSVLQEEGDSVQDDSVEEQVEENNISEEQNESAETNPEQSEENKPTKRRTTKRSAT